MSDVRGTVWADWEVDAIVANYFNMLAYEIAGRAYNKSERRRALQSLIGRDPGSVERKHQNISAVLQRLGLRPILGYNALPHFQNSLIEAVERYLTLMGAPVFEHALATPQRVAEASTLWVGPPPQVDAKEHSEPEALRRLVRKFDPAERD